jgi:hypothetical protein
MEVARRIRSNPALGSRRRKTHHHGCKRASSFHYQDLPSIINQAVVVLLEKPESTNFLSLGLSIPSLTTMLMLHFCCTTTSKPENKKPLMLEFAHDTSHNTIPNIHDKHADKSFERIVLWDP